MTLTKLDKAHQNLLLLDGRDTLTVTCPCTNHAGRTLPHTTNKIVPLGLQPIAFCTDYTRCVSSDAVGELGFIIPEKMTYLGRSCATAPGDRSISICGNTATRTRSARPMSLALIALSALAVSYGIARVVKRRRRRKRQARNGAGPDFARNHSEYSSDDARPQFADEQLPEYQPELAPPVYKEKEESKGKRFGAFRKRFSKNTRPTAVAAAHY